jgi:hypothetical protein
VVHHAPAEWAYGQTVTIQTPDAAHVKWASLVRNGVTTHSFNTSQRLVDLPIAIRGQGVLEVEVTDEPNLAPPGTYMLFLVNQQGVPSVATWVHLSGAPPGAAPSAYEQAVRATPSLAGLWRLDEPGGTVAFNALGFRHAAYINGPARTADGPVTGGQTVELDGHGQYVLIPRAVHDDFTLELWFATTDGGVGTANQQWFDGAGLLDGEVFGVTDDFGLSLDATGRVWAGTGRPDVSIQSSAGHDDGEWHHVAFTRVRHNGALQLYVDGQLEATGHGGTQSLVASPALRAGMLQDGRHPYAGRLSHIALYTTALPAATIQQHHDART